MLCYCLVLPSSGAPFTASPEREAWLDCEFYEIQTTIGLGFHTFTPWGDETDTIQAVLVLGSTLRCPWLAQGWAWW
jgi:hypothetical protein